MEHSLVREPRFVLQLRSADFPRILDKQVPWFKRDFLKCSVRRLNFLFVIQKISLLTALFQWHDCRHKMALTQSAYSHTVISRCYFLRLQIERA